MKACRKEPEPILRKYCLAVGLVVVALFSVILVAYALFVGTPRHPMTEGQAAALVRRELPLGVSVSQVKAWLDARGIEHSEYGPHHADGAQGEIVSIIRDTHRTFLVSSDIQVVFRFDRQRRLMGHSVRELLTGP